MLKKPCQALFGCVGSLQPSVLLSYFEKNSSLVGLNIGLCMYLSMYWVMSHQSD